MSSDELPPTEEPISSEPASSALHTNEDASDASTLSEPALTQARKRSVRWHIPAGLLVLLLVGGASWLILHWQRASGIQIPLPDLSSANTHVATVTGQLHEEVKHDPNSSEAWGKYASVLMAHEWNAEALICFQRAAELDAGDMRWPYLAGILLERRDPSDAIQWYEKAQKLDPSYAPLYVRMGNALQRLGRSDEAEASLQKGAELAQSQPQPLIGLARIAQSRDDWQKASELLEKAVSIAPTNREAIVELTRAKLMLGTAASLRREEQAALLSGEKYEPMPDPVLQSVNEQEVAARFAAMQADRSAAQGNLGKAAEVYIDLIKQRPDLSRPRLNLASVYMSQGQVPQAIATLREVVQLFPDDPMGHYALGVALEASNEYAEARREQETAVRLKPDYAEAHFALGLLAEREGDMAAATASYQRAVQSDARLARAHLALGVAFHKQQQWEQAIAEIKAAVQLSPGDPVPQSFLQKALAEKAAREKPAQE